MDKKKLIIFSLILLLLVSMSVLGFMPSMVDEDLNPDKYTNITMDVLPDTPKSHLPDNAQSFTFLELSEKENDTFGYASNVILLENGETVTYEVVVEKDGKFNLLLDTYPLDSDDVVPLQLSMKVNGTDILYAGNKNINLQKYYLYQTREVNISSLNDQTINPIQSPHIWESAYLYTENIHENYLSVDLQKGINTIELTKTAGHLAFGDLHVAEPTELIGYNEYIQQYANTKKINQTLYFEGEDFSFKNMKNINPLHLQDIQITPHSMDTRFLNTIDGQSFSMHNARLGYEINVQSEGLYRLGFAYKGGNRRNASVFANIYVNGQIPFAAFKSYKFPFSSKFINMVTDEYVYLEKGLNSIVLEMNQENFGTAYDRLRHMYDQITDTAIELRMLTGNKVDRNRTWNMADFFPTLEDQLRGWVVELEEIMGFIDEVNDYKPTEESLNIELSITQINKILENMEQLPNQMNLFSSGNNSIAARLSAVLEKLQYTPLFIDKIYLTDDIGSLPGIGTNVMASSQYSIKKLLRSFSPEDQQIADNELQVWVRRPRQNIEVMQRMIDQQFTEQTGIRVRLSLLADQSKLTMANAAGTNPDVVTGVDSYYVSDIGQRGALENLKYYPGIKELVGAVTPGSMLQMFVEDSIFGIPETQEFYFTLYRTDIMDRLGLSVPNTWEEVQSILPTLQRFGMNYYIPLSQESAFKAYPATAPFIYQNNARIFASDGFSTDIGSERGLEAFTLKTQLFTIYGMPLSIASFYDSFRDGRIPIGVNKFSEYIRLYHAAPEIRGQWSIALAPGIEHDGKISRNVTGDSTALMMFKNSTKKEEAWSFIQWWLQTETQVDYLNSMQNIYGLEFLFIPANLETIRYLPMPQEHLDIIAEQIGWVEEVPRIPGGYVAEREISSAFLNIVNNGREVRSTVDDTRIIIDRELKRKMEEFGYLRNGQIVKPYTVHTIESIESWLNDE